MKEAVVARRREREGWSSAARGNERVPRTCAVVFAVAWTALAIDPKYRDAWLLENLLTFALVPVLVLGYPRLRLDDRSYVQLTVFLLLHTVGSHYTYSEVPLGDWARDALGLSRNHYDRFVHFAFGALLLHPVRELSLGRARGLGRLSTAWLSVAGIAALSTTYEIVEWLTAIWSDPGAGTAFLGTQGDVWDAQKDSGLACLGAILALAFERPIRSDPA